jgi:Zn-finger nucleic acid-binding protein
MESELPPSIVTPDRLRAEPVTERMLVACRACGRQYDVSLQAPGARVRCECGQLLTVEAERARRPRPLICGHCGGKLEEGARACAYCGAEITLEERGLSGVCPVCYARLFKDARFCMECGVKIEPQAVNALAEGAFCPRCGGALQSRSLGSIALVECGNCAGMWLAPELFDAICEQADKEDLVRRHLSSAAAPKVDASHGKPGYLACVECGDLMVRKNFGGTSGVIIDLCRGHGIWLDHRELERILDFVHGGGLMRAREREVERARSSRSCELADIPALPEEERASLGSTSDGTFLLDALRWIGAKVEQRISR